MPITLYCYCNCVNIYYYIYLLLNKLLYVFLNKLLHNDIVYMLKILKERRQTIYFLHHAKYINYLFQYNSKNISLILKLFFALMIYIKIFLILSTINIYAKWKRYFT